MLEDQLTTEAGTDQHTPEDLLDMPNGHRFELVDGQLKERNMGARESAVALRILRHIGNHAEPTKLGTGFTTDCGYQIFPDAPQKVRFPDGSFILQARLPEGDLPPGHLRIVPDLAIEVVSPNDTAEELEVKRLDFFRVGTRQWWLVFPLSRTVHVFRTPHTCTVYTADQELTDDDVLPGFRCPVRSFFKE